MITVPRNRRGVSWSPSRAWLCFLLSIGCGSYDGAGYPASSETGEENEAEELLGSLEQEIGSGTLVPASENVLNMFGPAVKLSISAAVCSGVKIGPKKFLTAAHCFSDTATKIRITNSLDGVLPSTEFTITKQLRHPSHRIGATGGEDVVTSGLYDLKIIEIAETTNSIPIAKITPLAVAVGTEGYIAVGYGCDNQSNNDGKKQKGEFNAVQGTPERHVHYISENRSRTICEGDSGGPLFRLFRGEMVVTGINAGSALFTRVENTTNWIITPEVNVFSGTGSLMNLASDSASAFPPLNCAALMGTGTSTLDVKLEQCDGPLALYNGGRSVHWIPVPSNTGAGFHKIISFGNASCLGVDGASTADANVSAIPCATPNAALTLRQSQAWKFVEVGQAVPGSVGTPGIRSFQIVNERSGKCLSTTSSTASAVGSDVRQSTCSTARRDQRWVFTR